MKKTLLIVALIAAILVVQGVYACSCIPPQSPDVEYGESAAVFIAEVKNIERQNVEIGFEPPHKVVTLEVKENFKGASGAQITVKTADDSAMCGFNFEVGKTYLIYASELEGSLYAYLCSRTTLLSQAEAGELEVLRNLSQGRPVTPLPLTRSGDDSTGDDYTINSLYMNGDVLNVDVSYSGGCAEHEFKLKWSGALSKSLPPQATLVLEHDANGDMCEAYITKTFRFNVSELREQEAVLHVGDQSINTAEEVYCTMEARMCPDGSSVGRNPANNCEFDPCPGEDNQEEPSEPVEEKSALQKFVSWFKGLFGR